MIKSRSSGFTLVEILAAMAAVAVLLTLSVNTWHHSIDRARSAKCLSQLRMIGTASMTYAADNDMTLPTTAHEKTTTGSWTLSLRPYVNGGELSFRCPCDELPERERKISYVINDFLTPAPSGAKDLNYSKLVRLQRPSETLFFAEASPGMLGSDHFHFASYRGRTISPALVENQIAVRRHGDSANYLFADGHAENISWEKIQVMLAQVPSKFIDPTAGDPPPALNRK